MRRRIAILAVPVIVAAGLLVAGCGNYTQKTVSPLPNTVEGTTTPAPTTTATTTGAAASSGDATAGKAVFMSAGCAACHTLKDAGATGAVGPNLDNAMPSAALIRDRVTNGKAPMPAFKASLSAKQIDDVVAYVSSVAGK
jgi:mono/diheme cytochrome c family protein